MTRAPSAPRPRLLLALGVVAVIAIGWVVVSLTAAPSLSSVSSKTLTASGISFDSPGLLPGYKIDKSHAERLAVGHSNETVIREAVLARVHTHLLDGQLCWVVSVFP